VAQPEEIVECLTWKLRWYGQYARADHLPAGVCGDELGDPHPRARRQAFFDDGPYETDVYAGPGLPMGTQIAGPAIIEEPTTTIVVPPYAALRVSRHGNFLMELDI
jgi:N-methylhydantoinase A